MKNSILIIMAIGLLFSSCGSNGTSAETGDAQDVNVVETASTIEFNKTDPASTIAWRATHLGGVQPRFGKIRVKSANILVNNGIVSNATIKIDMASLTVENFGDDTESAGKLTSHLLNDDFFKVDSFAVSTFELVNIIATKGEYDSKVTGNLTIKGVTKSITFNANVNVTENTVAIKSEDFTVDRSDWGLTYHAEGSEGVPVDYLIADDIGFTIDVKISK